MDAEVLQIATAISRRYWYLWHNAARPLEMAELYQVAVLGILEGDAKRPADCPVPLNWWRKQHAARACLDHAITAWSTVRRRKHLGGYAARAAELVVEIAPLDPDYARTAAPATQLRAELLPALCAEVQTELRKTVRNKPARELAYRHIMGDREPYGTPAYWRANAAAGYMRKEMRHNRRLQHWALVADWLDDT